MSTETARTAVRSSIVVDAPIDRAFTVFTEGIGSWFPPEYNLLPVPIAERVFEPRVGGRIYDRGEDGSECHWARVLAFEPPARVVSSWDIVRPSGMRSLCWIAGLLANRGRRSVGQTPQTRRTPWPRQRRKPTRSRARSTSTSKASE